MINPFSLSGLLIGLTCVAMASWVFSQGRGSFTNKLWAIFCISVSIWGFGVLAIGFSATQDTALIYWRLAYVGVIFIPALFFHFTQAFLETKKSALTIFVYGISTFFLVADGTPLLMPSVRYVFDSLYYVLPGPLYPYFVAYFVTVVVITHIQLWRQMKSTPSLQRRLQIRWFFLATGLGFAGGTTCYLPVFGVDVYPYGNFTVPLYPLIMTYAIVKHQLMDIEVVIRKTAVFTGLFAFVYGIFTIFTVLGQEIFIRQLHWNEWISMIPTVLLITFTLRPLENYLTNATEKFLFQKKFDYRELLRTFTNEVLTVLELQKLTEQTVIGLNKIIKLEACSILLLDKEIKQYKLAASMGLKDKGLFFLETDDVVVYLRQTHQPILRDKSTDQLPGHSGLRDDFKKLNARLCLPIAHHDELIGILTMGMKKSGEEFTKEDIDILSTLARTLGIAIANAQLFDQLSKTQAEAAQREKMAVIGTLAAGINHEICNPLGIVRGQCEMYLLNLRDGLYNNKTREDMNQIASEIMNKVIKETDRATAITKKLSGFAKPAKKVDHEEVFVEKEADEVLGLIGHDLRLNNIEFKKDFSSNFPSILADRRQIQEVLFNIIRNAAQAMEKDKKDGWIGLSGSVQDGSAIIKIADNGSGIPQDKIGQIFNPFFTTKEPGKGTGLGLFIVKQVIERNHGTIQVDSQEGVGTTFTLTFQVAAAAQAKVLAA